METFDIKKVFNSYGWNKGFKFEVHYSQSGVARIYIGDRKTKYYASGYGYDKTSSVIALMINDLLGAQPYNKDIYRNGLLSGGTGFSSIQDSFNSIDGYTMEQLYSGKDSNVYEIKMKKIKSLKIIGKRWFQKSYGNTYHSVKVIINDDIELTQGFTYGYEEAYLQTAQELLVKNGYINKTNEPIWRLFPECTNYVIDVNTKRELSF